MYFKTASARAGIIASGLFAHFYRLFLLHRRQPWLAAVGTATCSRCGSSSRLHLNRQHQPHGVLAYCGYHFVKHLVALAAVLDNRVLLRIGAQINALTQFIHRVDVIHPLFIHDAQQHDALKLTHNLFADLFFACLIHFVGALNQLVSYILFGFQLLQLVAVIVEIVLRREPAEIIVAQSGEIPVVRDGVGADKLGV